MTIGVPLGLFALAGLPGVVAAYLLRRKNPPRTVSAIFLWRATDDAVPSGPKLQRLRREWSLVLELLAVLAATAFLADVRFTPRSERANQVVIVVDGGLSMRARGADGRSFATRARERAKSLLASADVATIVETGARPHVIAGPRAKVDTALAELDRWSPSEPSHARAPAIALARELANTGAVTFLTDRMPTESLPKDVRVEALGEPLANVAFVSATRTDSATSTRLRLRVLNASTHDAKVPLDVHEEKGELVAHRDLDLAAGATAPVTIELPRVRTVVVSLPDDALPDDSRVTLLANPELPVWVRNDLDTSTPAGMVIARALAAEPDVHVGEPSVMTFASPSQSSDPWTITVGTTGGAAALRSFVGPFFTDHRTPLFDDVTLDGVVWTAGANPPGEPLLTTGDRVLVSEEPGPRIHFNVDFARSNVQRTAAFPVLMTNLLALRRASLPGFVERNLPLAASAPIDVDGSGWTLASATMSRSLEPGPQRLDALAPGVYRLMHGRDERDRLSVLAIDSGESDLRDLSSGVRAATGVMSSALVERDRSRWPILLLLAFMLADFTLAAPGLRRGFAKAAA